MKAYPAYKDSGVEWIGEIPEHWEIVKAKYLSEINPSKGSSKISKESEELAVFLPMEKVSEDGHYDTSIRKTVNELYNGFTYFEKGDIIVAKITPCFENGKGAILDQLDTKVGFGSTEFHVLRAKKGISSRYLYYLTRSDFFKAVGEAFMVGSAGQKRVPTSFVENFPVPIPEDFHEQAHIARFLDHKTHQIDTAIAKLERLIELLQEERAAVINEAVTRGLRGEAARKAGLDPDPPMKDSGIEWIGEAPAHWEVVKMNRIGNVRQGLQIPISDRHKKPIENSYKYITIQTINNPNTTQYYISNPSKRVICRMDDILIARTGATGQIVTDQEGVFHNNFFLFDFDRSKVEKKFLYYYLNSSRVKEHLLLLAGTTTIPDLNHGAFYSTPFLLTNKSEQKQIVIFIDQSTLKLDEEVQKVKEEITLLREYRQSLISEAVTGKIDVREYVV